MNFFSVITCVPAMHQALLTPFTFCLFNPHKNYMIQVTLFISLCRIQVLQKWLLGSELIYFNTDTWLSAFLLVASQKSNCSKYTQLAARLPLYHVPIATGLFHLVRPHTYPFFLAGGTDHYLVHPSFKV